MKVSPMKLAPPLNPLKTLVLLFRSRLGGSTGRMTHPFANYIKLR